jgi:hypothetical protein
MSTVRDDGRGQTEDGNAHTTPLRALSPLSISVIDEPRPAGSPTGNLATPRRTALRRVASSFNIICTCLSRNRKNTRRRISGDLEITNAKITERPHGRGTEISKRTAINSSLALCAVRKCSANSNNVLKNLHEREDGDR